MNDIINLDDVKLVVDCFYEKVRNDEQLKDVFNNVIQDRWPAHLEKMYRFWQTILLDEHSYSGSPFPPHKQLPVAKEHFDRWIEIFTATINSLFVGSLADEANLRAKNMAQMFNYKIDYFRNAEKNQNNKS